MSSQEEAEVMDLANASVGSATRRKLAYLTCHHLSIHHQASLRARTYSMMTSCGELILNVVKLVTGLFVA